MKAISVLIVDDHPMMREALKAALEEEPDFKVIAEAGDGAQGVALFLSHSPDVVLMDLLLPVMDGLSAIRAILKHDPEARIVVSTSMDDQENILAAIQAGARGFFPKAASRAALLETVRRVAAGETYLPGDIQNKLFQRLQRTEDRAPSDMLTPRQREVLELLGQGSTDAEIAALLHISEATVRTHIHHILRRLGLKTRAQAVAFANRGESR